MLLLLFYLSFLLSSVHLHVIDEAASISCGPNTDEKMPNFFDEKPQTLRVLNECFPCYFYYRLLFDVINGPCPHYFTELCVFIDLWGEITIEKYYSSHNPQKKLADKLANQQQVLCRFTNVESLSNLALLASILVTAIERSWISGYSKSFLQETVISFVNDGRKVWATVLFLSAIMQRKVTHVNFFLPFLQDHGLLT